MLTGRAQLRAVPGDVDGVPFDAAQHRLRQYDVGTGGGRQGDEAQPDPAHVGRLQLQDPARGRP